MSGKKVMKLATRGKRFAAGCIDAVIPCVAYLILTKITESSLKGSSPYGYGYGNNYGYGYGYGYNYGYNTHLTGAAVAVMAILFVVLIAYIVVEFIFFAKGKSIGKAITGLQVVSSRDGRPFGFWKMMLRELIVKQASYVMLLGYIWILIDEKNRAWHDKILDSYVVDLKESEKMQTRNDRAKAELTTYRTDAVTAPPDVQKTAVSPAPPEERVDPAEPNELEAPAAEADTGSDAETGIPEAVEVEVIDGPADEESSADAKAPAVNMSMKKDSLMKAAEDMGLKLPARATKAEIIEAIEKASKES